MPPLVQESPGFRACKAIGWAGLLAWPIGHFDSIRGSCPRGKESDLPPAGNCRGMARRRFFSRWISQCGARPFFSLLDCFHGSSSILHGGHKASVPQKASARGGSFLRNRHLRIHELFCYAAFRLTTCRLSCLESPHSQKMLLYTLLWLGANRPDGPQVLCVVRDFRCLETGLPSATLHPHLRIDVENSKPSHNHRLPRHDASTGCHTAVKSPLIRPRTPTVTSRLKTSKYHYFRNSLNTKSWSFLCV